MSASPTSSASPVAAGSRSQSEVITRLRAAGCVFAEDEAALLVAGAATPADLVAMLDRRIAGLPLEHVLGWAEFEGLRIEVDPGVFVPRRRTGYLVRAAARLVGPPIAGTVRSPVIGTVRSPVAGAVAPPVVVLDLCCGSGAIGAALAARLGRVEVYAVDIDPAAVRCARRNLAAAGGRVYQGDLYEPLPTTLRGRVDILVANAPYVPTAAVDLLPPEARVHEPMVALDGGTDGLDVLRRVAAGALDWLAPGGRLLVEASSAQAPRVVRTFAAAGLVARADGLDELDSTIVIAAAPGPRRPARRRAGGSRRARSAGTAD